MKITSPRYQSLRQTLRGQLTLSIKAGDDHAASKALARLNKVCRIARQRNLANGMPGTVWVDVTMAEVAVRVKENSY